LRTKKRGCPGRREKVLLFPSKRGEIPALKGRGDKKPYKQREKKSLIFAVKEESGINDTKKPLPGHRGKKEQKAIRTDSRTN